MKFCKCLQQLSADNEDDAEEEPLDEEEDAASGCIEEFDRLDISGGINNIANEVSSTRRWWKRVTS
jgi:hypothetical protein